MVVVVPKQRYQAGINLNAHDAAMAMADESSLPEVLGKVYDGLIGLSGVIFTHASEKQARATVMEMLAQIPINPGWASNKK